MQNVPIRIDYNGKRLTGVADPVEGRNEQGVPLSHIIYLQGKYMGVLSCDRKGWVMDRPVDSSLVECLGEYLHAWYE